MATLYTYQDRNVRKTWALMTMFLIVVIAAGWGFSLVYDTPGILYVAIAFSLLMNIGSYWYSDKIVLSVSGAHPIARHNYRELWNVVENLSITAGLPMPKVYLINDSAPNAFATGRDKEHAVVAVTTGLLETLERSELEGVIAHELAHIGNRDILLSTIVVVLVGFVTLLSDLFLRFSLFNGSDDSRARGIMTVVGIVLIVLSPVIATIIQLAISRKREFLADASGALLTRYPEGLASALEKISRYPGKMRRASNATAHLYISNPFGSRARGFVSKLFMTHPPVEERIRLLREMR